VTLNLAEISDAKSRPSVPYGAIFFILAKNALIFADDCTDNLIIVCCYLNYIVLVSFSGHKRQQNFGSG